MQEFEELYVKCKALTDIDGTQIKVLKDSIYTVFYRFVESGNYLIGSKEKRVYARKEQIEFL